MEAAEDCPFCRIAAGAEPGHVVWEDEQTIGFLDKRPLFHGHVLLIPRRHLETIEDLKPEEVEPLFSNARMLARAVRESMDAKGTFVAMNNKVSQSVPHLHVHVVPRTKGDGLKGFFWPRTKYEDEEQMAVVARKIRAATEATADG
jgi:histidine triad (HIT) family protein